MRHRGAPCGTKKPPEVFTWGGLRARALEPPYIASSKSENSPLPDSRRALPKDAIMPPRSGRLRQTICVATCRCFAGCVIVSLEGVATIRGRKSCGVQWCFSMTYESTGRFQLSGDRTASTLRSSRARVVPKGVHRKRAGESTRIRSYARRSAAPDVSNRIECRRSDKI